MTLPFTRRALLGQGATLSAAAVALLAGRDVLAAAQPADPESTRGDVAILNGALAAELQAIAAYGVGAGSGLLKGDVLKLAQTFHGHHQQHADVLRGVVHRLGGTPAVAVADYHLYPWAVKLHNHVAHFCPTPGK